MLYRNRFRINLFDNPLKKDRNRLETKNRLEASWYDDEADAVFPQLQANSELMPIDRDFEKWFAVFYDYPSLKFPYDRDYSFFSLFPKSGAFKILEMGCGNGCLSRFFLRRGVDVYSIDISRKYCQFIQQSEKRANSVRACAEILPFQDDSFDIITAFVALHHFNLELSLGEMYRVLKPGGRGLFIEPLANSRLLYMLRQLIPVKDNESPGGGGIRTAELARELTKAGFQYRIDEFELLTRLERLPFGRKLQRLLRMTDFFILSSLPFLRRLARTAVIEITKPQSPSR